MEVLHKFTLIKEMKVPLATTSSPIPTGGQKPYPPEIPARNRSELNLSLRQQDSNYRDMNQLNEELRFFRHDIKNHMLSLSSLLEKEDISQAKSYIEALSDTLAATAKIVNTENYIFDAILAEKTEKAKARHIQVENEVLIGKQLNIKNSER